MIAFLFKNYKATIAFISLGLTAILIPGIVFILNFFTDIKSTQANVKLHDAKIVRIEEAVYRTDEKFIAIKKSLERLEDREYQELKQARQSRLENK